jgi:hypothetical protein
VSDDEADDGVTYCETLDEAIAVAMIDAEDGTQVVIHDEACKVDEGTLDGCTCEPEVRTVRRAAA